MCIRDSFKALQLMSFFRTMHIKRKKSITGQTITGPVSYTHLDVYKRQEYVCV